MLIQLDPPLPFIVVGGTVLGRSYDGPTGPCMAILAKKDHPDLNCVFTVIMDATGEIWEVEHPFLRGEPNKTWGRQRPQPAKPPCE